MQPEASRSSINKNDNLQIKAQRNVGQTVKFKDSSNLGYPTISRSFRDGEEEI